MNNVIKSLILIGSSNLAMATGCMPDSHSIYSGPLKSTQELNLCYQCQGFPRICKFVDINSETYYLDALKNPNTVPQEGECAAIEVQTRSAIKRIVDGCEEDPTLYKEGILKTFEYRENTFSRFILD